MCERISRRSSSHQVSRAPVSSASAEARAQSSEAASSCTVNDARTRIVHEREQLHRLGAHHAAQPLHAAQRQTRQRDERELLREATAIRSAAQRNTVRIGNRAPLAGVAPAAHALSASASVSASWTATQLLPLPLPSAALLRRPR